MGHGIPSYNRKEAKKKADAVSATKITADEANAIHRENKRLQELYILMEGGEEVGIKSCLHKNRE